MTLERIETLESLASKPDARGDLTARAAVLADTRGRRDQPSASRRS